MEHLADLLKELRGQLQQTEADIAKENSELLGSQNTLKQLTAKKAALQRVADDLAASQSGVGKQREAANAEKEDSEKARQELLVRLKEQLSQEFRDDIDAAIKPVDDEIVSLQKEVAALKQQVPEAEKAATQAKYHAAALETALRETEAEIKQLPAQIAAATGQIAKLKEAANKDADGGRASEAYILAGDLKQAMDALQGLVDPDKETQLAKRLVEQGRRLGDANAETVKTASALDELKRKLAASEQQLQAKVKGREEEIRKGLEALSKSQDQPI